MLNNVIKQDRKKNKTKKSEKYWGQRRNGWAGAGNGGQVSLIENNEVSLIENNEVIKV